MLFRSSIVSARQSIEILRRLAVKVFEQGAYGLAILCIDMAIDQANAQPTALGKSHIGMF